MWSDYCVLYITVKHTWAEELFISMGINGISIL